MSDWLSSLRRASEHRVEELAARSAALNNKASLEEALAYEVMVQDGGSPDIVPDLIQACLKAPPQDTAHAWFSQGWCRIQEKAGVPPAEALKRFNSLVWKEHLKPLKLSTGDSAFPALYSQRRLDWLKEALGHTTSVLEAVQPPIHKPLAPPPVEPQQISHLYLGTPDFHSDDLMYILKYINDAPPPNKKVQSALEGCETYDDIRLKSLRPVSAERHHGSVHGPSQ